MHQTGPYKTPITNVIGLFRFDYCTSIKYHIHSHANKTSKHTKNNSTYTFIKTAELLSSGSHPFRRHSTFQIHFFLVAHPQVLVAQVNLAGTVTYFNSWHHITTTNFRYISFIKYYIFNSYYRTRNKPLMYHITKQLMKLLQLANMYF